MIEGNMSQIKHRTHAHVHTHTHTHTLILKETNTDIYKLHVWKEKFNEATSVITPQNTIILYLLTQFSIEWKSTVNIL